MSSAFCAFQMTIKCVIALKLMMTMMVCCRVTCFDLRGQQLDGEVLEALLDLVRIVLSDVFLYWFFVESFCNRCVYFDVVDSFNFTIIDSRIERSRIFVLNKGTQQIIRAF